MSSPEDQQPPRQPVPRGPRGRFVSGQSGNPKGRTPGLPTRLRELVRRTADREAAPVIRLLLEHATADPATARYLSDRMLPGAWVNYGGADQLGPLDTVEECDAADNRLLDALTAGDMSAATVDRLVALVAHRRNRIRAASDNPPVGA